MANDLETFIQNRDNIHALTMEVRELAYRFTGLTAAYNYPNLSQAEKGLRKSLRNKSIKRKVQLIEKINNLLDKQPKYSARFKPHMVTAAGKQHPFEPFPTLNSAVITRNKVKRKLTSSNNLSVADKKQATVTPRCLASTKLYTNRVGK